MDEVMRLIESGIKPEDVIGYVTKTKFGETRRSAVIEVWLDPEVDAGTPSIPVSGRSER